MSSLSLDMRISLAAFRRRRFSILCSRFWMKRPSSNHQQQHCTQTVPINQDQRLNFSQCWKLNVIITYINDLSKISNENQTVVKMVDSLVLPSVRPISERFHLCPTAWVVWTVSTASVLRPPAGRQPRSTPANTRKADNQKNNHDQQRNTNATHNANDEGCWQPVVMVTEISHFKDKVTETDLK